MATFTNVSKSTSPTFLNILRHGTATRIKELENTVFTDVIFEDGTTLQNATFAQLVDQVWANTAKSASPTFINQTRN